MDQTTVRAMRDRLSDVDLSAIETEFNVKLSFGNATFNPTEGNVKFSFTALPIVNGKTKTKEEIDFNRYCFRYGLTKNHLHKQWTNWDGCLMEIIGCKPRSTKFPILVKNLSDGNIYKYPVSTIKQAMIMAGHIVKNEDVRY